VIWILPAHAEAPPALQAEWAEQQPFRLRNEAIFRLESGDYEGAVDRFEFLSARRELGAEPGYYLGLCAELQRDFAAAIDRYTRVVEHWPESEHARNARFRRALCLEDLGRHDDSVADVETLISMGAWSAADRAALDLEVAFNRYEGRRSNGNERRLDEAIRIGAEAQANAWLRAKAIGSRVDGRLDEADGLKLSGNNRARRRLEARADLVVASEHDIEAIARLDEPEFVLRSMTRLGDAYVSLHDAMLSAKPPRRFGPDKRAIYSAEVRERSAVLLEKAWSYYDDGLQCALRVQWGGPETEILRARRDALDASGAGATGAQSRR
jgi:tetratricopeptide (TPR) repeat protein